MCTFILYCLTLIYENWIFFVRFLELTIWCSHQLRFLLQATEYNLLECKFSTQLKSAAPQKQIL